jgi:hypothetical protein
MSFVGASTDCNIWAFGTVELQAPEGTLWYGLVEAALDRQLLMDGDTTEDAAEEEEMEPTQPYHGPSDDDDATQPFYDDEDLTWPAPFVPPEEDEMPKLEKPPVFVKLVSHVTKPDPARRIVYRYVF